MSPNHRATDFHILSLLIQALTVVLVVVVVRIAHKGKQATKVNWVFRGRAKFLNAGNWIRRAAIAVSLVPLVIVEIADFASGGARLPWQIPAAIFLTVALSTFGVTAAVLHEIRKRNAVSGYFVGVSSAGLTLCPLDLQTGQPSQSDAIPFERIRSIRVERRVESHREVPVVVIQSSLLRRELMMEEHEALLRAYHHERAARGS